MYVRSRSHRQSPAVARRPLHRRCVRRAVLRPCGRGRRARRLSRPASAAVALHGRYDDGDVDRLGPGAPRPRRPGRARLELRRTIRPGARIRTGHARSAQTLSRRRALERSRPEPFRRTGLVRQRRGDACRLYPPVPPSASSSSPIARRASAFSGSCSSTRAISSRASSSRPTSPSPRPYR